MNFNVYKITLKSLEKIELPYYSGFAFRGLFGNCLKKVVCILKSVKQSCNDCILKDKCIYSTVFESPKPKDNGVLKGVDTAPHPFIIVPEKFNMQFNRKGSTNSIFLTLFGKADEYLPFFVVVFEKMGKTGIGKNRGKFIVKNIKKMTGINRSVTIYSDNSKDIKNVKFSFDIDYFKNLKPKSEKIVIRSFTPLRLKKDNKFVSLEVDLFDMLIALKRRLRALSYYHSGKEVEFPKVEDILEGVEGTLLNSMWLDLTRFSSRQKIKMKMGGLMLKAEISGDIEKVYPYLKLMEFVHIGKNASFGLGKIEVIENSG